MTDTNTIAAAIVAALPENCDLVPWTVIRSTLPGTWWQHVQVSTAMFERGEIVITKVRGRNYVSLPLFPPNRGQQNGNRSFMCI